MADFDMGREPFQLARTWSFRATALENGIKANYAELGEIAVRVSRKHMRLLIYDFPVPDRPNGKPSYKRTFRLLVRERWQASADGMGGRLINDMPYAEVRHEANKPGRRTMRHTAHWRDEAVPEIRELLRLRHIETIARSFSLQGGQF